MLLLATCTVTALLTALRAVVITEASTPGEIPEDDPYAMADRLHTVEGDTPLVALSRKGDIMQLRQLFKESSAQRDINERGGMGHTPLMAATIAGQPWAVRFLLQQGADPTIADPQGYTPIDAAAFQGRYKVMEALLDSGVSPRHEHRDGLQPLHRACAGPHKRHAKTVQVLLSSGKVKFNDATSTGLNCELLTRNPDVLTLIAPQAMAQAKVAERRRAERAAAALEADLAAMDDDVEEDASRTVIRNAGDPQVDEDGRVIVSAAETHVDVDWDREVEDGEEDDDEDDDDYDLVDAEI
ncbi:hypothetical protein FOZ62_001740 [Perkinsus olseni]|uniref:Ankyrin Repeat n=3 Tax=Perkinsus olseni TaxID=32597 RepID=A0A7J6S1C7_PEROL|nr:hypothetical protein FOZ62_001740 [Perkinsus olseni]